MQSKTTAYLRIATAVVLVLGGMAFFMRRDPSMPWTIASVAGISALCVAIFASSKAITFINRHPTYWIVASVVLMVLDFAALIGAVVIFPNIAPNNSAMTGGFVSAMLVGCLLITLPRSARRHAQTQKAFAANSSARSQSLPFKAANKLPHPYAYIFDHFGAFAKIVLPWILFLCLLPLFVLQIGALTEGSIKDFFEPVLQKPSSWTLVEMLFASEVVSVIAIPMATLYWQRFVIGYRAPIALVQLPSRSTVKYFFALFAGGNMLIVFSKMIAPDVFQLAKWAVFLPAQLVESGVNIMLVTALIWFFAPMALALPAAAVGDKSVDLGRAVILGRRFGVSLRNNLVLSLMPAIALSLILEKTIEKSGLSLSIQQIFSFASAFIYFLGLTAAATYLAMAYQSAVRILPEQISR